MRSDRQTEFKYFFILKLYDLKKLTNIMKYEGFEYVCTGVSLRCIRTRQSLRHTYWILGIKTFICSTSMCAFKFVYITVGYTTQKAAQKRTEIHEPLQN